MKIDFIGLQDMEVLGYIALLTYRDGRKVRYDFDTDSERDDFVQTVKSYIEATKDTYTFNPN